MKKLSKNLIIMLIMIMALATLFVACAPTETVEYNVSFDVDGVVTATIKTGGNGSLLSTPVEPTKEGFVFGGWYLDKDTWAQPVTFESVKNNPLKADIKVFAKWNIPERTVFNVKFDFAGGQSGKDWELTYTRVKNDTLIVPEGVTKVGFVFKGWSPELAKIVTADVTYTAVWEVAKCKYSFWDGVGGILKEETINYGEKIIPPTVTPTRAPDSQYTYTFSGWDKAVPEKITEDIQFIARFETTVNKYTITFVNDDGTELYTNQFDYGSTPVYEGATPTKPRNTSSLNDYIFAGWGSNITVTDDATLMAKFDDVRYAFKTQFIVDGTLVSYQIVNKNADAVMPEQPTKSGYTFAGWQESGATTAPVLAVKNVTADKTYLAVWTKI